MRFGLVIALMTMTTAACVASPLAAAEELPDRPLTLADCVLLALERNPQITASEQGIVVARAGLSGARSSYYPQLSLSATEGLRSSSSLSGSGPAGSASNRREDLDLVLDVTFWRAGRRESVAESAAAWREAQLSHAATLQGLVEQVAQDYYGVLAAQQLVGVAEAGVESARQHLEMVEARVSVGDVAEVEVLPAADDMARARLDLIDARSSVQTARARLRNSMGVPPGVSIELAAAPEPAYAQIPALQEAVAMAAASRPEVLASQTALQASGYALDQAEIRGGPVIDLSGQYVDGYTDWRARDAVWSIGVGLTWPLFDGYGTKADETAAQARVRRGQADLQRTVNQVGLEVENALVEAARTRERLAATATSVAAAQARLDAAEGRYQHGVVILLEVIDARVAVTSARAEQVRARYDYQTALVTLDRALGRLHVPEGNDGEGETATP